MAGVSGSNERTDRCEGEWISLILKSRILANVRELLSNVRITRKELHCKTVRYAGAAATTATDASAIS